jgi:hypothetical protein
MEVFVSNSQANDGTEITPHPEPTTPQESSLPPLQANDGTAITASTISQEPSVPPPFIEAQLDMGARLMKCPEMKQQILQFLAVSAATSLAGTLQIVQVDLEKIDDPLYAALFFFACSIPLSVFCYIKVKNSISVESLNLWFSDTLFNLLLHAGQILTCLGLTAVFFHFSTLLGRVFLFLPAALFLYSIAKLGPFGERTAALKSSDCDAPSPSNSSHTLMSDPEVAIVGASSNELLSSDEKPDSSHSLMSDPEVPTMGTSSNFN